MERKLAESTKKKKGFLSEGEKKEGKRRGLVEWGKENFCNGIWASKTNHSKFSKAYLSAVPERPNGVSGGLIRGGLFLRKGRKNSYESSNIQNNIELQRTCLTGLVKSNELGRKKGMAPQCRVVDWDWKVTRRRKHRGGFKLQMISKNA